jgi:hypothetical protein
VTSSSIFFEFSLPNSTTWFYFSFILAYAIFFRFDRVLSLRNWDLFTLYLLVPGFLCLQEAHGIQAQAANDANPAAQLARAARRLNVGYIWLICASGYFFFRTLFDLGLEKRPALSTNLTSPGLAWLTVALFISLTAKAVIKLPEQPVQVGREPVALTRAQNGAVAIMNSQSGIENWGEAGAKFFVERGIAIALHLAVVLGLVLSGAKLFGDLSIGVAMACLYLLLPYTATYVAQIHHVWPAAFMLWAIFSYKTPILSGALLGVAAGSTFFPLLLFPLWFGFYRERGTGRFTLGFLLTFGLSLLITAAILIWSGDFRAYLSGLFRVTDWQAWKAPQTESIWMGYHWAYRLPIFVAYMIFIILTMFWPKPRNLAQVIAQSAAVVIGVQFWYSDQGGVYILWYLPLLLLMFFRPNLSQIRPPILISEPDWVARLATRVRRRIFPPHPKIRENSLAA